VWGFVQKAFDELLIFNKLVIALIFYITSHRGTTCHLKQRDTRFDVKYTFCNMSYTVASINCIWALHVQRNNYKHTCQSKSGLVWIDIWELRIKWVRSLIIRTQVTFNELVQCLVPEFSVKQNLAPVHLNDISLLM